MHSRTELESRGFSDGMAKILFAYCASADAVQIHMEDDDYLTGDSARLPIHRSFLCLLRDAFDRDRETEHDRSVGDCRCHCSISTKGTGSSENSRTGCERMIAVTVPRIAAVRIATVTATAMN